IPARSVVSANTVCGSNPETKMFAQTVWDTKPVATRIARSGRKMAADTANAASTNAPTVAPADNLREITPALPAPEIGSKLLEPDAEKAVTGFPTRSCSNQR